MGDRENREDWRRERSLLALGQAVRGEDEASLVSLGDRANPSWREDAATRHRLARSQREAKMNPAPSASAATQRLQPGDEPAPAPSGISHSHHGAGIGGSDPAMPYEETVPEIASSVDSPRSTSEPLSASEAGTSPGEDADSQQWKPLIDPMQVVRGVARSKALIITTTVLGAALGVAIALSTPKKYESTTELIVDPRDLKLTDRDLTQAVVMPDAALVNVENQIKLLTSGTVLNKVVQELDLVDDPEFNGQGNGGLGVMSLIRSILLRQDGPGGVDQSRRLSLAIVNLAESVSVERGGKTSVITIGVTTQDAQKSALIAETMTKVFLQTSGEIQSDTAGRANNELTAKLDEMRKGVEAAERKVEDFRATHDLVDAQGHLISDDQMLKLNEQLSVARARTLELNARAASARQVNVNSVLSGTLPEEINSNSMSDLRSQYATLKQEADRAAVRLGPRHPERQALEAQLTGARERIVAELSRIASSLQVDLKRSVQLEQDLASRLAQMKVRSGDVNSDLVSMRELEREASAKRSVYEQYLLRAKETGEQKNINTANMSVISPASIPLEPNGPSRAVVALAGLLLGFASGVGLGAVRGAYESLRETAGSRSRRDGKIEERRAPLDDQAFRAPPPPAPPIPQASPPPPASVPPLAAQAGAAAVESPGRIGALMSRLRKAVSRKPAAEAQDDAFPGAFASAAVAEEGRPANTPTFPDYPAPDSAFGHRPPAPDYPRPSFQPGADAGYARPMGPPSRSPLMPQQAMYPASSHPYAQPLVYPHMQPWQTRSAAGHPQATAPYGAPMPCPAAPAPAQSSAYPAAPLEQPAAAEKGAEQASIEEIRASLREFREAVRELTESRAGRRYF
ncbi:succinoglycan biosynthesis protein exop [Mesorhizobium sp. B1-1-4]|uniref:GumC family protein n=1 Tax=Mesorhizobium sp. B1-1-4 TaxID=2589980 RepID=UPI00112C14D8|nr:GumC family protein [Mesorhizobium sp. B1-1-4]TPN45824.1 succinoglycan biosynthesis protein exop [Mesorhizobium sp. B1-1-4]